MVGITKPGRENCIVTVRLSVLTVQRLLSYRLYYPSAVQSTSGVCYHDAGHDHNNVAEKCQVFLASGIVRNEVLECRGLLTQT